MDRHEEDTMSAETTGRRPVIRTDATFIAEPVYEETTRHRAYRYMMAITRITLGWVFLWAFLDKTFALGFGTGRNPETGAVDYFGQGAAWLNGGSPTEGYLGSRDGTFADAFTWMAGSTWADWLFMMGLLGIGVALVFGFAMRIAAASGALLMSFMWLASIRLDNNPIVDDHVVYGLVMVVLAIAGANKTLGLGRVWEKIPLVDRHGFLK